MMLNSEKCLMVIFKASSLVMYFESKTLLGQDSAGQLFVHLLATFKLFHIGSPTHVHIHDPMCNYIGLSAF